MRTGSASFTAMAVASFRAAASASGQAACDPHDAMALRLLPPIWAAGVGVFGRSPPLVQAGLLRLCLGLADHVALRSAEIDAAVEQAVSGGVSQVVIVGAGLDSRAHRLVCLADSQVFEVDHPDTQRQKRLRSQGLGVTAKRLKYVPADLSVSPLAPALAEAGHDTAVPTVWIVEGLVPYLPLNEIRRLVESLANLSAPGSTLAVSYVTDSLIWLRELGPLFRNAMRLLGEPILGALSQAQMTSVLQQSGWQLGADEDTMDWVQRRGRTQRRLIAYERLAVAQYPATT